MTGPHGRDTDGTGGPQGSDPTDRQAPLDPEAGRRGEDAPVGQVPVEGEPGAAPPAGGADPGADGADGGAAADDELTLARIALEERTLDLQRLQAEYLNYKRRVDRDRELTKENATYSVLTPIVEVLDNIDRAKEHGELDPGFKQVADQLERVVSGLGLVRFGAPGEPFDPTFHEALSHLGAEEGIETTTVKVVAKAGYRIGERVVRAAQVLVVDPA